METIERAEVFVVNVYNEGGCVCPEIGDEYDNLADALKEAKSITREEAETFNAYNEGGKVGVNVTITCGTKEELLVAGDGCNGCGLVIYDRFL